MLQIHKPKKTICLCTCLLVVLITTVLMRLSWLNGPDLGLEPLLARLVLLVRLDLQKTYLYFDAIGFLKIFDSS